MAVNLMMTLSKHIDIANKAKNIMSFHVYLNISSLHFGSCLPFAAFTETFYVIYSFLAWLIQHFICILQSFTQHSEEVKMFIFTAAIVFSSSFINKSGVFFISLSRALCANTFYLQIF